MATTNHIRWLPRHQIDDARWDATINGAAQSRIYGLAIFLDHMAAKWDALVLGDYEMVMPLTWNRKWGIKYLYQPPFTQQLGVFSSMPITASIMREFTDEANARFRFAEIALNSSNGALAGLSLRANFVLPLDKPYEVIRQQYKSDLIRNLKKTGTENLVYGKNDDVEQIMKMYERSYAPRTPHVKKDHYVRFGRLCNVLKEKKMLLIREAKDAKGELLATALLLIDKKRIYLVQSTNTDRGRQLEANHYLLDELIREFSGSGLILDFEGSDIAGIAHFYRNFGSHDEPYYFYRSNGLPWPLNRLK